MFLSASSVWSPIRLKTALSRQRGGQVAVMFVVIIALIIALAAFTMNLGEVARLKTSTANAADAGALAAASWIASGENEVAKIAQGMWINVYLVQAIFLIPFCWAAGCLYALLLMAVLALVNGVILKGIADEVLHGAWDRAQADGFFIAVQNLLIDDESTRVSQHLQDMSKEFQDTQQLPLTRDCPSAGALAPSDAHCFEWERDDPSSPGNKRKHWVAIQMKFPPSRPTFEMADWGPWTLCLIWWPTCTSTGGGCCLYVWGACVWPCFRMPRAWVKGFKRDKPAKPAQGAAMSAGQKVWNKTLGQMAGFLPNPVKDTAECGFCLPAPWNIPMEATNPKSLKDGDGEVKVTVIYHRQGGVVKGGQGVSFWTTRYPAVITSEAIAHYTKASVGSFGSLPDAGAVAELVPSS